MNYNRTNKPFLVERWLAVAIGKVINTCLPPCVGSPKSVQLVIFTCFCQNIQTFKAYAGIVVVQ